MTYKNDLPNSLFPFVWHYLKNQKWCLAGFILISLVWAIEMSLSPYLVKILIDHFIQYAANPSALFAAVFLPAVAYIGLTILLNFNFRLYDYINLYLYPALKSSIGADIFAYLLHHSHAFFQNTFTGSLTKKINDLVDIELLIRIPNEWFFPRCIALLIASATLSKAVHPIFGIILFVWTFLFIYFSYIASKKSEHLSKNLSESGSKMHGTMSDSIGNVMTTKLFANIVHEITYLKKDIQDLVADDRKFQWHLLKVNVVQGVAITLLIALMIAALIYGRMHGWVSAGDVALVLTLSNAFINSVYAIGQQMQQFSKMVGTCNQALRFIKVPHEISDIPDAQPIHITQGLIQFSQVSFTHAGNKPLFTDLNVTIRPGEKIGLVGYSGGGKSTFIKLILRLIDTQSGHIFIDGQDIKKVTKDSLRKYIGTIPQESDLFHRSIMENIRFAKTDATDAEVIKAAKKARCHKFISELPEQYQSLVGERGVKLSGGQKQRIAIARAFLKNAPILLLDEATSSLDSITEQSIKESLHTVMQNKTTIVIAHRLSTLKDMDRILVFAQGKIVEDGSLAALLENKKSHFYTLWQMQAEGFIPSVKDTF